MQTYALWVFGIWFGLWVLFEGVFMAGGIPKRVKIFEPFSAWAFVGLMVIFIPFELIGAYFNKCKGDTFSEFIWGFIKDGHARSVVGISIGIALSFRAATFPLVFLGVNNIYLRGTPWWLLCAGLAGWLVQHFPELGVEG